MSNDERVIALQRENDGLKSDLRAALEDSVRLEDELKAIRELIAKHGKDCVYDWHFRCVCGKQFDWMGGANSSNESLELATKDAIRQGWICRPDEAILCCSPACVDTATRHHRERIASIDRWMEETGKDKCSVCGARLTRACPNCEVAG